MFFISLIRNAFYVLCFRYFDLFHFFGSCLWSYIMLHFQIKLLNYYFMFCNETYMLFNAFCKFLKFAKTAHMRRDATKKTEMIC